jgi:hypothetical protein
MKHSLSLSKKIGLSLFMVAGLLVASQTYRSPQGSDLPESSVTLSNPRLSFVGRLAAGNVSGTTTVTISTAATISSQTTNQLQEGDAVRIGQAGSMGSYTVKSTTPHTVFTTTAANSNVTADDFVIASQSASLTVRFKTASAQNNGKIRVLVPAAATTGADGIPDTNTFDYGSSAPTVTCPTNITNYTFAAGAAASMQNVGGSIYHTFTCAYTGTGTAGANFTNTAQLFTIASLINPSPQLTPTLHTTGTADTYKIIVQQLSSADAIIDSTTVSVGVIEAVKVTAEVAPQITFSIAAVTAATDVCGITNDAVRVTTTATTVPFGELALNTFRYAAQRLSVSTNANYGYAVTAIENDQMGLGGAACTGDAVIGTNTSCIQDSRGDGATMSHTAEDDWNLTANDGFAYTLASATGSPVLPFLYSQDTGGCTATGGTGDCYRQFADAENSQTAQTIMSYTDVTNTQAADVCYAINVGATQTAGTYENYLTYTATGTF